MYTRVGVGENKGRKDGGARAGEFSPVFSTNYPDRILRRFFSRSSGRDWGNIERRRVLVADWKSALQVRSLSTEGETRFGTINFSRFGTTVWRITIGRYYRRVEERITSMVLYQNK